MKTWKKWMAGLLAVILTAASLPAGIVCAASPDHIVINQIYGGGGKGDTPFSHSFIELYNPTGKEIDLSEYTITYSSNRENSKGKHAGSTWQSDGSVDVVELELNGTLPAEHSYLILCAEEETEAAVVIFSEEKADQIWDQVIDNDQSVEIILYQGDVRIDAVSTRTTDFQDVGEGDAPASDDISKQKSLRRTNFADTDNNAADFSLLVWKDLPEEERQAFIDTYRPRSLADGEWTENLGGEEPDGPTEPTDPVEPAEPEKPGQDFTLKTEGFENDEAISLNKIGTYLSGVSDKDGGVAEIVSYDAKRNEAWVVNGATGMLDILSLSDVTCAVSDQMPAKIASVMLKDSFFDFPFICDLSSHKNKRRPPALLEDERPCPWYHFRSPRRAGASFAGIRQYPLL